MSAKCYDCGLSYGGEAWADVLVPDEVWLKISPTGDSGGLLCFNCINRRCTELRLRNVPFDVVSGPMCFSIREPVEDEGEEDEAPTCSGCGRDTEDDQSFFEFIRIAENGNHYENFLLCDQCRFAEPEVNALYKKLKERE